MKNVEYVARRVAEDRDSWIAEYRAAKAALEALETAYRATMDKTPADTVEALTEAIGADSCKTIIATLINRYAWDGRINRRVAEWAKGDPNAYDEAVAVEHWFSTTIHLAHLNQIAEAAMKMQKTS